MRKCERCEWFRPFQKDAVDEGNKIEYGQCLFNPPMIMQSSYLSDTRGMIHNLESTWPKVCENDYCSKFKDVDG